jgi:hypothetical protein
MILGYLRRCMDRRFGEATRCAFEQAANLGANDYWDESTPGGSAISQGDTGIQFAITRGATVFGWQAHGNSCGGLPSATDEEIMRRLDEQILRMKKKYKGIHYRIFVTENAINVVKL